MNGVAVAVFQTDFDLAAFFSLVSPEQLVAASADLDDPLTLERDHGLDRSRRVFVTQYVGLHDSYTYRMDILVDDEHVVYGERAVSKIRQFNFDMSACFVQVWRAV